MTPPKTLRIDFVSDVACPWCAIGLWGLQIALDRLQDVVQAEIHPQPFQLNPDMPPEGEDIGEHLMRKYGMGQAQLQASQEAIRQRGASVGFEFRMDRRSRTWNTFEAHRLLHWAEQPGQPAGAALALKRALLRAYFTDGLNPGDRELLCAEAGRVGLDAEAARAVLERAEFTDAVRARMRRWTSAGIQAVPAIVIDERHLIEGGQPPDLFERALRQLAAG